MILSRHSCKTALAVAFSSASGPRRRAGFLIHVLSKLELTQALSVIGLEHMRFYACADMLGVNSNALGVTVAVHVHYCVQP
jgi:hypothetical protein